ncbi:uncharacterized protein MELLADRAFT_124543 [Melampsora larici-populina 98AG31]|uniref:Secreted protein n=1 Tax=Melampsora larici-populina (strain 98AG31 / pathotype 3-4-7) TaxID=747676 RepID=F4RP91_MELLP|nr:uncharacterized protein MELLADRAFT_124543 [Melampsora larici-populina 98AG31]EGG05891.1 secreted protein [Melampsora larici-populina 98AG31]
MLFFKIIIAAVLAATISASRNPAQVDQTVPHEVLQRRQFEKRSSRPLKTRDSGNNPSPNTIKPQPTRPNPPTCHPCDDGPGCC